MNKAMTEIAEQVVDASEALVGDLVEYEGETGRVLSVHAAGERADGYQLERPWALVAWDSGVRGPAALSDLLPE